MHDGDRRQRDGLSLLLELIDAAQAERVRARLGLPAPGAGEPAAGRWDPADRDAARWLLDGWTAPGSVMLWMLECDDPDINRQVYASESATPAIRRDILRGVPFGPGARGPVTVHERIAGDAEPDIRMAHVGDAVVDALRRARTMRQGRAAAMAVTRDDWNLVAVADLEEPLPGGCCPSLPSAGRRSHTGWRRRWSSSGRSYRASWAAIRRPGRCARSCCRPSTGRCRSW
ncbi:hypothetical protein DY245_35815 [Streptomyces inhibens]|uniref:Uncharacterized protein n=1 Tax=Streptomyces inhibens TaxID=2293571 RepID=A0A371PTR2_STRIH|nr:hypothetical protein [Streptomyces inhibens]REK85847.1 hypothetical protein DY245_35815 [Streptomyces inhibens]